MSFDNSKNERHNLTHVSSDSLMCAWNRSGTIGVVFSRVKKQRILFPSAEEVGTYLDEFACVTAEYDDVNRTVKYTRPETLRDDALHAANYALLVGIRLHNSANLGIYW